MRVAFLLNPTARSGRAARLVPALQAAIRRTGLDGAVHLTERPRHAEALARALAADARAVVAVGGDGTVSEVAAGLAGGATPLGIVPFGTGNDLAATLGVPRRTEAAVDALARALRRRTPPRAIDVLRVRWTDGDGAPGERVVANAVGVGFDAAAAAGAPRYKRLGGRTAYLASVAATLGDWARPDRAARVWADGALVHDGPLFLCEVGNGPRVGGGFVLAPGADLGDGAADLCLVRHVTTSRALRLLPLALRGTHVRAPEVATARASAVRVEATGRPLPVHGDGEPLSAGIAALEVAVWPRALRVVGVPPAGPGTGQT